MAMVCLCHGVNERRVRRTIDAGATTIAEITTACRAGGTCYGCHPTIAKLLADAAVPVTVRRAFELAS